MKRSLSIRPADKDHIEIAIHEFRKHKLARVLLTPDEVKQLINILSELPLSREPDLLFTKDY